MPEKRIGRQRQLHFTLRPDNLRRAAPIFKSVIDPAMRKAAWSAEIDVLGNIGRLARQPAFDFRPVFSGRRLERGQRRHREVGMPAETKTKLMAQRCYAFAFVPLLLGAVQTVFAANDVAYIENFASAVTVRWNSMEGQLGKFHTHNDFLLQECHETL